MQHRDWIERASAIASNELSKAVAKLGLQTGTTGVSPVAEPGLHTGTTGVPPVVEPGLHTGTTGVPPVVNGQDARSPVANGQDARSPSVNGQDARSPSACCSNGIAENRWYRVAVTNGVIYSIYDKDLKPKPKMPRNGIMIQDVNFPLRQPEMDDCADRRFCTRLGLFFG